MDTTNLQVNYLCPPGQGRAVHDAIDEFTSGQYYEDDDATEGPVTLGSNDMSVGSAAEVHAALLAAINDDELPDFAYLVYEDPAYESLGELYVHIPDMGEFAAPCDSQGRVVTTGQELAALVARASTVEDYVKGLNDLAGLDYIAAWDRLWSAASPTP